MKKLIVIGIVVAMVMGMAVAANAQFTPNDKVLVGIKAAVDGIGMSAGTFGTQVGAIDDYDTNDKGLPSATAGSAEIICTDLPANGTVADGRFYVDKRAPLDDYSQIKVWDLKASLNTVPAGGDIVLTGWMISSGKITSPDFYGGLYAGSWTAQEIKSGAADTSLIWQLPTDGTYGSASSPQFTSDGYHVSGTGSQMFTLCLGTIDVPEPGSMVALFSGLVGLIGFGIRRRK